MAKNKIRTDKEMDIETLEGTHHASVGDWIITGVKDEQYPYKLDIFEKTYIEYGQTNKMEQVAKLFGKKLGEEFEIIWEDIVFVVKITEDGLVADCPSRDWDSIFVGLLTGEAVIVDENK